MYIIDCYYSRIINLNTQQNLKEDIQLFLVTLIFFYKHNNYKDTYGKKCEKISIMLR